MESDQHLECVECGASFVLTAADAASFTARGLVPPKRCAACRKARRTAKADRRGPSAPKHDERGEQSATKAAGEADAPRPPARRERPRPAREEAPDASEYRSPMQTGREHRRGPTGDADEYRSPMSPSPRAAIAIPKPQAPAAQAPDAAPVEGDEAEELGPSERRDDVNEYRSPMTGGVRSPTREYRSPMRGGMRGASREYRSPMTGGARGANDYRSPMQSTSDPRRGGGGRRAR